MVGPNSASTWRQAPQGECAAAGDDGDGHDLLVPGSHRGANGGAFRANRQPIGCVFDVAAGEDFAGGSQNGGADVEVGVRSEGA